MIFREVNLNPWHKKIKEMLETLNLAIEKEVPEEGLFVVNDPSNGIYNLLIDCEDPVLVLEQLIVQLSPESSMDPEVLKTFLQLNRTLVHGAFTMDESGRSIVFRDTLQIANLDLNELEGSVNALSLGLAEHGDTILALSKSNCQGLQ